MHQLEDKKKKFVLEFKAPSFQEDPRPALYLSEIAAQNMSTSLMDKGSKFINRYDDAGGLLESISKNEIRGIRRIDEEMEKVKNDEDGRLAVCEYGGRHRLLGKEGWEPCNCCERFSNMPWLTFQKLVCKKWSNIQHEGDITEAMRNEMEEVCLKHKSKFKALPRAGKKKGYEPIGDIASRLVDLPFADERDA